MPLKVIFSGMFLLDRIYLIIHSINVNNNVYIFLRNLSISIYSKLNFFTKIKIIVNCNELNICWFYQVGFIANGSFNPELYINKLKLNVFCYINNDFCN